MLCPGSDAGTGGLTVGITEEPLHGLQVFLAQPGLVVLRGNGHKLQGGVFEQQVLLAIGFGAEHLEAAVFVAEQKLRVKGKSRCGEAAASSSSVTCYSFLQPHRAFPDVLLPPPLPHQPPPFDHRACGPGLEGHKQK